MNYKERVSGILIAIVASSYAPDAVPTALVAAGVQRTDSAPAGRFRSFRIPTDSSEPRDITMGSDGHMWFTESNIDVSQIGRIDARGNIHRVRRSHSVLSTV
jgi:streptogramin lyase